MTAIEGLLAMKEILFTQIHACIYEYKGGGQLPQIVYIIEYLCKHLNYFKLLVNVNFSW